MAIENSNRLSEQRKFTISKAKTRLENTSTEIQNYLDKEKSCIKVNQKYAEILRQELIFTKKYVGYISNLDDLNSLQNLKELILERKVSQHKITSLKQYVDKIHQDLLVIIESKLHNDKKYTN